MRYSQVLAGTAVLFFIAAAAFSQDQTNSAGEQIFLNVTVFNNKDDLLTGLTMDNFKVYEQKKLVPITSFTSGKVPMTVGILIDRSRSTNGVVMPVIRDGLKRFINDNDCDNEYFVMAFGKTIEMLSDVTSDNARTLKAVENIPDTAKANETRFFDAIEAGAQKASTGQFRKKILLILSDGQDNGSRQDLGKVQAVAEKYGLILYFMDLGATDTNLGSSGAHLAPRGEDVRASEPGDKWVSPAEEDMDALADASGGSLFPIITNDDLDLAFSLVSKELQSQYQLGFSFPAEMNKGKKARSHNFSIKLESLPSGMEKQKPRTRARSRISS